MLARRNEKIRATLKNILGVKEFSAEEVTEVVLQGGKVARQDDAHYPIHIGGRAVASRLVGKGSYAVVVNGFYIIEAVVVKVWEQAHTANSAQGGILAEAEALQLCPSVFPSLVGFHAGEPAVLIYRRYNMGSLDDAIRSEDLCPLLRCPFGLTTILTSVSFSMVKMDQAGIVHRDLKLDNIVLGMRDGQLEVSIADPGLATKHGMLVKGARNVGNSAAQPAEVYLDGPFGSVTHTSDVPAASTISAQLLLSLGFCLENWPKPYPSLRQLLIDALVNPDNLPLLITKQAVCLWQLDGSNSYHVIVSELFKQGIVVRALTRLLQPQYVSKMPRPLRGSLATVFKTEYGLYEVLMKKTLNVPFTSFRPVDDRAPLPEKVLPLRELPTQLQVPEAPVQDIYLGFTQPGSYSSTCPFIIDLWTYLSFLTHNNGKQTVEELAAAVIQETVRIARAATGDQLFHQHLELQEALKKLAPAVELAWGGCHHGKRCYDDRVQSMVTLAWKMVVDLQLSPAVAERIKEQVFANSAPTAAQASLGFTMAATSLFLGSASNIAAYGIRAAAANQGDSATQLQELVLLIATACFAYQQCKRGLHDNPKLVAEVEALVTMATPTFCWASDQLGSLPLLAELPKALLQLSCQLCVGVLPCCLEAAHRFLLSVIEPPQQQRQHLQQLCLLPGLVHHHAQSFFGFEPAQGAADSSLPQLHAVVAAVTPAPPAAADAAHIADLMQRIAACADAAGPHGVHSPTLLLSTACTAATALATAAPPTLPLPFKEQPSAVQRLQPPVLLLDQLPAASELSGCTLHDQEQQQQKEGQQQEEHKPNPLSPRNRADLEPQIEARPPAASPAKQHGLQQGVGSATPVPPILAPPLPRPACPSRLTRGRKQGVLPAIIESQELVAGLEAGMPMAAELQVPARTQGALSALTADLEGCTLGSARSTGADTNAKGVSRRTVFARLRQGRGITRAATGAGEQEGGFQLASSAAAVGGSRSSSKRKTRCDSGMLPDSSKKGSRASSQPLAHMSQSNNVSNSLMTAIGLGAAPDLAKGRFNVRVAEERQSKWLTDASDFSHAALDDDLVAEAFCKSQGIPPASLRKLKAKAKTSGKLLETRLAGSIVDPSLAAGAGSVRLSATATACSLSTGQRVRWSTFRVCSDFFGMLDSTGQPVEEGSLTLTQERDYRWRLLQSIRKYSDDPMNKAGIRAAGSGMVEARLNAEFAEEHGVIGGTGSWFVFRA